MPEASQEHYPLQHTETCEREHTDGNLRSLLMTFTISCLSFVRAYCGGTQQPSPAGTPYDRADKANSAFSFHRYLHGFIKQTSSGSLSLITVPILKKAVKQKNGHQGHSVFGERLQIKPKRT